MCAPAAPRPIPWTTWSAALAWRIEFEDAALKELAKLDKPEARRILAFLRERVAVLDDPRRVLLELAVHNWRTESQSVEVPHDY